VVNAPPSPRRARHVRPDRDDPVAFSAPTPLDQALRFADNLLRRPNARIVRSGERHWPIFQGPAHARRRRAP
jgi:hypothetical protein